MKKFRVVVPLVVAGVVSATAVIGTTVGPVAALTVGIGGSLVLMVLLAYVILKTLQLATQRLAGLQAQQTRLAAEVKAVKAMRVGSGSVAQFDAETRRALEDLRLASRSLTVPQAHFDQLLRAISANSRRTEMALDEAVQKLSDSLASGGVHHRE